LQNDPICVIGAGSDEVGEAVQLGGYLEPSCVCRTWPGRLRRGHV